MTPDKAKKVLGAILYHVAQTRPIASTDEAISIMREEVEQRCKTCDGAIDVHGIDGEYRGQCPWCAPQAPAEPLKRLTQLSEEMGLYDEPVSDAEIYDIWEQTANCPGANVDDTIRFARALLEKAR